MVHARACPVCGKIIPWTKGEEEKKVLPSGIVIKSHAMLLICPEHGEFRDRAETRALKAINNLEGAA